MHIFSLLIQIGLYAATSSVLLVRFIPQLQYLLLYGKTLDSQRERPACSILFKYLAKMVPKSWFVYFYVTGVLVSVASGAMLYSCRNGLWTYPVQLLLSTDIYLTQVLHADDWNRLYADPKVSYSRALWTAGMLTAHCGRRLVECLAIENVSSTASIRLGHYIVGHIFYIAACCACWTDALEDTMSRELDSSTPVAALLVFILASLAQHSAHKQLAQLKKYSPPPPTTLFLYVICPHYLADVAVYLSCALACGFTPAFIAVIVWTVVNLGASSEQTREFYIRKFGKSSVAGKWNMLPLLF